MHILNHRNIMGANTGRGKGRIFECVTSLSDSESVISGWPDHCCRTVPAFDIIPGMAMDHWVLQTWSLYYID